MGKKTTKLYGLLAKYKSSDDLIAAAGRVVEAGYRRFDAYTPYPVEELSQAMRLKPSPMPYVILAGGILGNLFMLDFMVRTGKKPSQLLRFPPGFPWQNWCSSYGDQYLDQVSNGLIQCWCVRLQLNRPR